jgi:hypothetical protein
MKKLLKPWLQIETGYVEAVGSALRLYRFQRFHLTVCWSFRYPRLAVTIYE